MSKEEELKDSIFGLLESFHMATGKESPLGDMAKGCLKGFFIGEIETAEKLLDGHKPKSENRIIEGWKNVNSKR